MAGLPLSHNLLGELREIAERPTPADLRERPMRALGCPFLRILQVS